MGNKVRAEHYLQYLKHNALLFQARKESTSVDEVWDNLAIEKKIKMFIKD